MGQNMSDIYWFVNPFPNAKSVVTLQHLVKETCKTIKQPNLYPVCLVLNTGNSISNTDEFQYLCGKAGNYHGQLIACKVVVEKGSLMS